MKLYCVDSVTVSARSAYVIVDARGLVRHRMNSLDVAALKDKINALLAE